MTISTFNFVLYKPCVHYAILPHNGGKIFKENVQPEQRMALMFFPVAKMTNGGTTGRTAERLKWKNKSPIVKDFK